MEALSNNSGNNGIGKEEISGFVQVTGGRIWYRIVGADMPGTPLLVLHGGPGAPHDYLETLEALADERPVIFYDQLGCGHSGRPADTALYTVSRFVDEVEQVCFALQLRDFHLLGQSWGGMLALEFVLRKQPPGLRSIILSAPLISTKRWISDQEMWISKLPEQIREIIKKHELDKDFESPAYQEAMMHFYQKHLCRLDPWPECLTRTMEKMGVDVYNFMWGPSEFTMTGTLADADLSGRLSEISVPVLLTCGEFDEATPDAIMEFHKMFPNSDYAIIPDASHSHHLEKPEEYVVVVRSFLKRIKPAFKGFFCI